MRLPPMNRLFLAVLVVEILAPGGRCLGQQAAGTAYASWSRVENSDELADYKERLKKASALDEEAKSFLLRDALPQLAREENRSSIERVRRRIRERLLTEIGSNRVLAEANGVVAGFMDRLAREGSADPVVRVNATLLLGELQGSDRRPWPDGMSLLASLAGDPKVAMAVRAAAIGSLAKYGPPPADSPQVRDAVASAVIGILTEPGGTDGGSPRSGRDWLTGRAAGLLPTLVTELPEGIDERLAQIVADESRSTDVRVRAAAAVGAGLRPAAQLDAVGLVEAIRSMAVRMLGDEVAAVESRRFEQEYRTRVAGAAVPAGEWANRPDAKPLRTISDEVLRRHSWRLVTLAGAIDGGDGAARTGGGIAAAAQGASAETAKSLAATLRQGGLALDANPAEETLRAVLESLQPDAGRPQSGSGSEAAVEGRDGEGGSPGKSEPGTGPSPSASPFDSNPFP